MITPILGSDGGRALLAITRGLGQGAYMLYQTFWALLLGFSISGAVQAFATTEAMTRRLGSHRPAAIVRASAYGVASSSCSYAASAIAKSLFSKGADFVTANVFMVASTNLVIELGVVLAALIGWSFVAGEYVGGIVMIGLLAFFGPFAFRGRVLEQARQRTQAASQVTERVSADHHRASLHDRLRSGKAWREAARFALADIRMLKRELVVGYVLAGLLAVLVPNHLWSDLFWSGHGIGTSVENVVVGPLIALLSSVCSIGNVPIAAALWKGGITFGGVVSFIFADLIAFPLLAVYRRMYGTAMALRMLATFWFVMSLAGLITEVIFRGAGIVPRTRPRLALPSGLSWNATSIVDLLAVGFLAVLFLLDRGGPTVSIGGGFVTDPVCGMRVNEATAPASVLDEGRRVSFCSDSCRDRFTRDPSQHRSSSRSEP